MNLIEFFSIKINPGMAPKSGGAQPLLMDTLRSDGAEVMQTSDGLVVKTEKTLEEMQALLAAKDLSSSVVLEPLDMATETEFPPDLRKFVEDCAH